jgi:Pycsar effector protein
MDTRSEREFAWRVHEAQESWIGKVDMKASVVLAFEAAVVVLVITSDGIWSRLQGPSPWIRPLGYVAVAFLLAGVVFVGAAVWPSTGRVRRLKAGSVSNLIYFGHLRHIPAEELVERLGNLSALDELHMLSQQIVTTSRINWRKHRMIQCSLLSALVGLAALVAVVALGTVG